MNRKFSRKFVPLFFLLVISILLFPGCGSGQSKDQPNQTLVAISTEIAGTATAEKAKELDSGDLATAQVEATLESEKIFATQTAQLADRDETKLATATIAAPIVAELPTYGLDASSGKVGWIHDPLSLEISGYQQFAYGNDFMNVTAKDFVWASDITWDTQYGDSGCGFMFRSDGDKQKPNQYMIIISRFANGRLVFTAIADGEIANIREFYPKDEDRSFQWQNGTTNRIAIVARGNMIEVYTNGVKIGEIDTTQPPEQPVLPPKPTPPTDKTDKEAEKSYKSQLQEYQEILQQSQSNYQIAQENFEEGKAIFTDGFLSMIALTQSGRTVCTFDKNWLWLLEPY
jgi:hypothetical protein